MSVKEALGKLFSRLSERRRTRITSVVSKRTKSISILLENVTNEPNVNAIVRSMDATGSFVLHRLDTKTYPSLKLPKVKYPVRTDAGAGKWIRTHKWDDTFQCITHLKEHDYHLAVASPNATLSIEDVDFSKKLVVAFGNETDGISEELSKLSDLEFSLPMCGFVESYNVSVAAAITLYHSYLHRMSATGSSGDLDELERDILTLEYCLKTLDAPPNVLTHINKAMVTGHVDVESLALALVK